MNRKPDRFIHPKLEGEGTNDRKKGIQPQSLAVIGAGAVGCIVAIRLRIVADIALVLD